MNLEMFLRVLNIPNNLSIDEILDMLIIYLRKSRKDMDYYKDEPIEKTLQRHEKDLQDFAIAVFGKPIPEKNIYREVVSGDTIEDRPVMQKVLSLIEENNVKGVICIEIERLARGNTIDQGIIAQAFQYTNTKIITPMKIYDLDNEDDLSYFEDGLYQSRKYLKYTKRILARGRVRSVKEGKYVGSILPYGYNKVKLPNEKGFMLVQNKDEANIVKLMADIFLDGLNITYTIKENDTLSSIAKNFGVHKSDIINCNDGLDNFNPGATIKIIIDDMRPTNIAHYFNYSNIKPRKAKEWTANMIRNILQSNAIYGYLTWDKRKTVKTLENGKVVKKNPNNNDYLLTKGKHYEQRILDDEYKSRIQEKFKNNRNKTVPDNKELKNPLVGLVICDYCGNHMTRRPYYEKKDVKPSKKRICDIDRDKLRLLLREKKGNYSLSEIARELHVSKNIIAHWFAPNDENFTIPSADKWFQLKKLLNIETNEFDDSLTTIIDDISNVHEDTLMCSRPRCKCVSSDLKLVEDRIIQTLRMIKNEYKLYIDNYEEEVKKEINTSKELLQVIEHEISKINTQLEKACELVETGAYTQDLFIMRSNALNVQLQSLLSQKKELSKTKDLTKEFNAKRKAIPILEDVLNKYTDNMNASEKNALLSTIIEKVIYSKDKGGRLYKDNFTLKILLVPFD